MKNINPVLKFIAKNTFSSQELLTPTLVFCNIHTHNWCQNMLILQIEYKYCGKQSYVYGQSTEQTFFTGVQRTLSYVTPDENKLDVI